jgi:hypothetical protein
VLALCAKLSRIGCLSRAARRAWSNRLPSKEFLQAQEFGLGRIVSFMKRRLQIVGMVSAVIVAAVIALPFGVNVNSFRPKLESFPRRSGGRSRWAT